MSRTPGEALARLEAAAVERKRAEISLDMAFIWGAGDAATNIAQARYDTAMAELRAAREDLHQFIIVVGA